MFKKIAFLISLLTMATCHVPAFAQMAPAVVNPSAPAGIILFAVGVGCLLLWWHIRD